MYFHIPYILFYCLIHIYIALEHGVVNYKYGYAIFSRQRLNFFNRGGTEQRQKPPPCIATVIQEAIDRIFARKGFTFLTLPNEAVFFYFCNFHIESTVYPVAPCH